MDYAAHEPQPLSAEKLEEKAKKWYEETRTAQALSCWKTSSPRYRPKPVKLC